MTSLLQKLLWKELYELVRQPWMLIGAFLIPLYLLHVATILIQPDHPTRVLVAGSPDDLFHLDEQVEEISRVEGVDAIRVLDTQDLNILMARHNASLGILVSEGFDLTFLERSSSLGERRLNFDRATRINRALGGGDQWLTTAVAAYVDEGGSRLKMRHMSVLPGSESNIFLPRFMALIVVFLATLLGARSMLRELESRTMPLLATLPNSSWTLVLVSKLVFVVLLTSTITAFLMLSLQPAFGFYLRPGLAMIYGACLLTSVAAASIGIFLALLGNNATQAYVAISVYLIANLILTGFVTSLQELSVSGDTVMRALFPLTYLRPILEGWLFFGEKASWRTTELVALLMHVLCSLLLLTAVAWHRRQQF
ncbi:ABC transporter permease [uncultured Ruegeria sp.]|uniref:ABC transporter permease n=1 Tax=uncultured Ruegeria sp. TaxID=259304 RepID=UPI00261BEFBD|nr:ABC transporter permease [uncultured Ruegeria sp.]